MWQHRYTTFSFDSVNEFCQKLRKFLLKIGWKTIPVVSRGIPLRQSSNLEYRVQVVQPPTEVAGPYSCCYLFEVRGANLSYSPNDVVILIGTNSTGDKVFGFGRVLEHTYNENDYYQSKTIIHSSTLNFNCAEQTLELIPVSSPSIGVFYSTGLRGNLLPLYFVYAVIDDVLLLSQGIGIDFLHHPINVIRNVFTDQCDNTSPLCWICGDKSIFLMFVRVAQEYWEEYYQMWFCSAGVISYYCGYISIYGYSTPKVLAVTLFDTMVDQNTATLFVDNPSQLIVGETYYLYVSGLGKDVIQCSVVAKDGYNVTVSGDFRGIQMINFSSYFLDRIPPILKDFKPHFLSGSGVYSYKWYNPIVESNVFSKAFLIQPFWVMDSGDLDPAIFEEPVTSGYIEEINGKTFIDTTKNWDPDSLVGKFVIIDMYYIFRIVSNTNNSITIDADFNLNLYSGNEYVVVDRVLIRPRLPNVYSKLPFGILIDKDSYIDSNLL